MTRQEYKSDDNYCDYCETNDEDIPDNEWYNTDNPEEMSDASGLGDSDSSGCVASDMWVTLSNKVMNFLQ